jgi:hypothetical protein
VSRNSVSVALCVLVGCLAAPALYAAGPQQPETDAAAPVLAFDGRRVTASNITPGGQVVYFAAAYVPEGWKSTILRWSEVVTDDDRDGTVTLDAGRDVPAKSAWVVADMTNGHFAAAAPGDMPLRQVPFDKRSLRKNAKGDLELFLHSTPFLELLYVHPGKGAWTGNASDSSPDDADGTIDGITGFALSTARPLAGEAAPKDFAPGGILIAIDLYRLQVVAERLDGQMLNDIRNEVHQ